MTREEMDNLTADAGSLSEKIRILHDSGVPAADIARYVGRRYQHVYNVIKDHKRRQGEEGLSAAAPTQNVTSLTLGRDGTLQLPGEWLAQQGLREGDRIICRSEAGGLFLLSRAAATEMLRGIARKRMPEEAALFDALLGDDTKD